MSDPASSFLVVCDRGDEKLRYPGGKGAAGVHQKIINLMPVHDVYIETHLGGGNILARKKPVKSIAMDADPVPVAAWREAYPARDDVELHCQDAHTFLMHYPFTGHELVYCDPPYVMETRTSGPMYRFEYTDEQHVELLSLLKLLPCAVMISGYWSSLYEAMLQGWERVDFQAMTRGGVRTESVWMNYEPPAVPADLAYVGDNFRERERIKRKKQRWSAKLSALPAAERAVIMAALLDLETSEITMAAALPSAIASYDGVISP